MRSAQQVYADGMGGGLAECFGPRGISRQDDAGRGGIGESVDVPAPPVARSRLSVLERVATAAGIVLLAAVAALAFPLAGIEGMRSDACTDSCSAVLIGAGTGVIAFGPTACVLSIALVLLLQRPDRTQWWVCGLGLLAAIAAVLLGESLITAGIGG